MFSVSHGGGGGVRVSFRDEGNRKTCIRNGTYRVAIQTFLTMILFSRLLFNIAASNVPDRRMAREQA